MPNFQPKRPIIEQTPDQLVAHIARLMVDNVGPQRKVIAIAGPPASGKSTLLTTIVEALQSAYSVSRVIGIPMDGFHLDNGQLELDGTRARKGAPHTFDVGGIVSLVQRLRGNDAPIYAPEFDRASDLSRNCAIKVDSSHDIVLIEGNYLLLDLPGWRELANRFDLTISIDVPDDVLQQRLERRWLDHGLSMAAARERAQRNDIPNAATVRDHSSVANISYRPENK